MSVPLQKDDHSRSQGEQMKDNTTLATLLGRIVNSMVKRELQTPIVGALVREFDAMLDAYAADWSFASLSMSGRVPEMERDDLRRRISRTLNEEFGTLTTSETELLQQIQAVLTDDIVDPATRGHAMRNVPLLLEGRAAIPIVASNDPNEDLDGLDESTAGLIRRRRAAKGLIEDPPGSSTWRPRTAIA